MNENEESRKSQERDARVARAAMKSLAVAAPAELKAELKRRARARRPAPSLWESARKALSGGAWAYGAGAAFAAAAALFLWSASPRRAPAPDVAAVPFERVETAPPQSLRELWVDDDGEDHDEG